MTSRLECRELRGGHGDLTAFRDIHLAVEAGSILALLGPNGAGKTSLLMTLAGILPAKNGTVDVDGARLRNGRPGAANRAGLVFVPDDRCLFVDMSVEENIRAAAHRTKRSPKDVLELFPSLESRWRIRAGSLSGGEQQMLVLARAFIQDPKVLLVDELSLGLAPLIVEALFDAVRRMADQRGCAVVLVEQHVSLALGIADDAAVLNKGRVVLAGDASKLRDDADVLERAYLGTEVASS